MPGYFRLVRTAVFLIVFSGLCTAQATASRAATHEPPPPGSVLLSPAGGDLKLQEALVGEHDDYPTFTRDIIQLTWRAGDPIQLALILPKGMARPPVILYLYTYTSDSSRFLNDDFCAFLARRGFAAVGFVAALSGQRYHDRPMRQWFVSELPEALGSTVQDVHLLLDYLTNRGDVDVTRAGMFGEGSGAAIAVMAAATDPRIKVLDLVDAWGDWPNWLAKSSVVPDNERASYISPEFLRKAELFDPVGWLKQIRCPVRLQYLGEPSVTPDKAKARIIASAPPQAQIIPHEEAVARYKAAKLQFFDWIKEQLRPGSVSQEATGR
jgi:dienelactone hydrolase